MFTVAASRDSMSSSPTPVPAPPLTCQPPAVQRPIFHIVGNVTRNTSSGDFIYENINDANGVFRYKGVWHVFHQCCQNHWDHVVSTDLVHWKRLPSPAHPDSTHWYVKTSLSLRVRLASAFSPHGGYLSRLRVGAIATRETLMCVRVVG